MSNPFHPTNPAADAAEHAAAAERAAQAHVDAQRAKAEENAEVQRARTHATLFGDKSREAVAAQMPAADAAEHAAAAERAAQAHVDAQRAKAEENAEVQRARAHATLFGDKSREAVAAQMQATTPAVQACDHSALQEVNSDGVVWCSHCGALGTPVDGGFKWELPSR